VSLIKKKNIYSNTIFILEKVTQKSFMQSE